MNVAYMMIPQTGGSPKTIITPIMDDINIQAQSEFSSFAEMVPLLDQISNVFTTMASISSKVGEGTLNLRAMLDSQRWVKTNPVKINVAFHFYTKSDPQVDVIDPIHFLYGLHILTKIKGSEPPKFKIPGISLLNINKIRESIKDNKKQTDNVSNIISSAKEDEELDTIIEKTKDSIFAFYIPGIIYLPYAYIFSIDTQFSKHKTESNLPLWAIATLEISGIGPAIHTNFTDARKIAKNKRKGRDALTGLL